MRKVLGDVLIALGLFSVTIANVNSRNAPDLPSLIGSFWGGILFLILGLALSRRGKATAPEVAHDAPEAVGVSNVDRELEARGASLLESRADLGGFVFMLLGGGIGQRGRELLLLSLLFSLGGSTLWIWGCANYMRWKGYSSWFGLFGLLLLPGLAILVCFPNRRKRGLPDPAHHQSAKGSDKRVIMRVGDDQEGNRSQFSVSPG